MHFSLVFDPIQVSTPQKVIKATTTKGYLYTCMPRRSDNERTSAVKKCKIVQVRKHPQKRSGCVTSMAAARHPRHCIQVWFPRVRLSKPLALVASLRLSMQGPAHLRGCLASCAPFAMTSRSDQRGGVTTP